MSAFTRWRAWARQLKREAYGLYLAYRDPRVPWPARLFAAIVVAYAFSPIDLIPDFIPVLGYLDDLILVPLGIWLALRLIPADVLRECREQAEARLADGQPTHRWAVVLIVLLWLALAALAAVALWRWLK